VERLEHAVTFSRRFRAMKSVTDVLPPVGHPSAEPGAIPQQTSTDVRINFDRDHGGALRTPGAK
jgi:hypothetical protein